MTFSSLIHISILDDDDEFRAALRRALAGSNIVISDEWHTPNEICVNDANPCDVLLYGIEALTWEHIATLENLHTRGPQIKIMLVAAHDGAAAQVLEAYRQGAVGYLLKDQLLSGETAQLIQAVHCQQPILTPQLAGRMLDEIIQQAGSSSQEAEL
ncbi:MAG: response regulator transcription factor [Chloroflexi bacterium]|nr:response regulator transcription factor [Chloroflexota bacterium]